MVIFFPTADYSDQTKRNIFDILNQLPFNRPEYNIEVVGDIHRSHFIARFPNRYWLRIHVYKKIDGFWKKIINSAHIFLRYKHGQNKYINPPSHQNDPYLPDTSSFPNGEWEYFDYTLRP